MTERAAMHDLAKYRLTDPTVVIIDDQSTGRMVLREIIRLANPLIKVVPFSQPVEAIKYIHQSDVDMVITDYMMPRFDGLQTTRELRRCYGAAELPIVMTTIVHSRGLLYRAFEAGVSDYIVRPVDPIECRLRFENMLMIRGQFLEHRRHIDSFDQRLEQALADSHDAHDRHLQRLRNFDEEALSLMRRDMGRKLDPDLSEALEKSEALAVRQSGLERAAGEGRMRRA